MNQESYNWDFSIVWEYREPLFDAFLLTISLAGLTIILGMLLGVILAVVRSSSSRILYYPVAGMIEVVRAVPPLVLLVWAYYCLPILVGVSLSSFQTAVIALAIYSSSFFAEIFRAGLQSVAQGQIEAAFSVGMTRLQMFRRIAAPLALQKIAPPLVGQCVLVIKNTSLASYITVAETLYLGQQISIQTFRPLEILTVVALMFLSIILPLTTVAGLVDARFRRRYGI